MLCKSLERETMELRNELTAERKRKRPKIGDLIETVKDQNIKSDYETDKNNINGKICRLDFQRNISHVNELEILQYPTECEQKGSARLFSFLQDEYNGGDCFGSGKNGPKKFNEDDFKRRHFSAPNILSANIDLFLPSANAKSFYGASSCQVFDNAIQSFLSDNATESQRYFFPETGPKMIYNIVNLPDKAYALQLVDIVNDYLGREFYLLSCSDFKQRIDHTYCNLKGQSREWLCYFFAVLALGEQYLNVSSGTAAPGTSVFFQPTMQLLCYSFEEPTLMFIQTLLLIAVYSQSLNRVNTTFNYYGMAVRSALLLGIHRKAANDVLSMEEKEKRKRLWWTIFVMETVWGAKLGQSIHISIKDTDLDFPAINSYDLQDGFRNDLLDQLVKMCCITGKVMRKMYKPMSKKQLSTVTFIQTSLECLSELEDFYDEMPSDVAVSGVIEGQFKKTEVSEISPPSRSVANLHLRYNQAVIVCLRPLLLLLFEGHIQQTSATSRATSRCITAARNNIKILNHLRKTGWLCEYGFWDAQYCFSAILIMILDGISGEFCPEFSVARELGEYLSNTGNFTAKENQLRLLKLEKPLMQICENRARKERELASEADHIQVPDHMNSQLSLGDIYDSSASEWTESVFETEDMILTPEFRNNLAMNFQDWDSSTFTTLNHD